MGSCNGVVAEKNVSWIYVVVMVLKYTCLMVFDVILHRLLMELTSFQCVVNGIFITQPASVSSP